MKNWVQINTSNNSLNRKCKRQWGMTSMHLNKSDHYHCDIRNNVPLEHLRHSRSPRSLSVNTPDHPTEVVSSQNHKHMSIKLILLHETLCSLINQLFKKISLTTTLLISVSFSVSQNTPGLLHSMVISLICLFWHSTHSTASTALTDISETVGPQL